MSSSEQLSFLARPSQEQQILINTIGQVYLEDSRWPRWQWVDETIDSLDLDAAKLLASLPRSPGNMYGYTGRSNGISPTNDTKIPLTLAGWSTVPGADDLVNRFLGFLANLAERRMAITSDKFSDEEPRVAEAQLLRKRPPSRGFPDDIKELMKHEPATWSCNFEVREGESYITLPSILRRFKGVTTIGDYLDRLYGIITKEPDIKESPRFKSPFTLPAAIDYLDVVWKLKFNDHLVQHVGLERSARLAFSVSTSEELDSCLSALSEVLNGLKIPGSPGVDGHPLQRLPKFLKHKLPDEAHDRINAAVEILDAARMLRHAGQHYGPRDKAPSKWAIFDISYPVFNVTDSWEEIQSSVAGAVDAIRNEIQSSVSDPLEETS